MKTRAVTNVFDLLAILCSRFTKEEERKYAIKWDTATADDIYCFLEKYKNLVEIILKSGTKEYNFSTEELITINAIMYEIEDMDKQAQEEAYLLTIKMEECIKAYDDWQCRGMIYSLEPLNKNHKDIGISVYPHFNPQWNSDKSERHRERTLNAKFRNYMFLRAEDALPFKIVMHYWNDSGILTREESGGWRLKTAVTPIWDSAELKKKDIDTFYGKGVLVQGIENEEEVENKILKIFDDIFDGEHSIIIFPEAIGTKRTVEEMKQRMRMHPEYCTFVLAPTICCQGNNTLVVLGPGGVEVLNQVKSTPFILKEGNVRRKEELEFSNELHVLITKELGNIVFPICAEFLDPLYYPVVENVVRADTILCPSFSPGIGAFRKTLIKGLAGMMLSIWGNTCSAKWLSQKGRVSDIMAIIQLPDADIDKEGGLRELKRECEGHCYNDGCYFEVLIEYRNEKFYVDSKHCKCA